MDRNILIQHIKNEQFIWDILVIGGGASGLGIALDAASRGYRTLLLEKGDFAHGTSSRSTKLIHGGLRYLKQGSISLVHSALKERAVLLQNAPHLVHSLEFILPAYGSFNRYLYYAGIKIYDLLAGSYQLGRSALLSRDELLQRLPTLNPDGVTGGGSFFDGQFDDARLAINLAQTLVRKGGTALNYISVQKLLKRNGQISGVIAKDLESGNEIEILGKVIINATGIDVDIIRKMDEAAADPLVVPSQGTHIVLDQSFFPGDRAAVFQALNGSVLFAIPWKKRLLVGTTDTFSEYASCEPIPKQEEIAYLLSSIGQHLIKKPSSTDIQSAFSGIRPLLKPKKGWKKTTDLPRDYKLLISPSKLLTIVGGKWTTYRKIGEETVDAAIKLGKLPFYPSATQNMPIHGWTKQRGEDVIPYGSDAPLVNQLAERNPLLLEKLHPTLPCRSVDVIWAVQKEMARTIEDVLSRRNRSLLLGARACIKIAPTVVSIMARELGKSKEWEQKQLDAFHQTAQHYIVG